MALIKLDAAVQTLEDAVPEFPRSGLGYDREFAYGVYDAFARYVLRLAGERTPEARAQLQRAFDFINWMVENGVPEVENLVEVAVLEVLTETPDGIGAARALLAPQPREWFEKMVTGWLKPQDE